MPASAASSSAVLDASVRRIIARDAAQGNRYMLKANEPYAQTMVYMNPVGNNLVIN